MLFHSFFHHFESHSRRTRAKGSRRRTAHARLIFEPLEGRALPSFVATHSFDASSSPISVAVGDFNRDGLPDLAVANYYGNNVSVLVGNGDGTFQVPRNFLA